MGEKPTTIRYDVPEDFWSRYWRAFKDWDWKQHGDRFTVALRAPLRPTSVPDDAPLALELKAATFRARRVGDEVVVAPATDEDVRRIEENCAAWRAL